MSQMMKKLWSDDQGALIAMEFLFVATILVIGIIAGLTSVRGAVNAELTELANAILALSQGYTIGGQTGCCGSVDGSQAIDTPDLIAGPLCTPPAIPSVIDVVAPCN
jgi:Flp pilus assembly pilin Flp